MTRDEILALEGRDRDAAVHIHVMGFDEWDTYYYDESWDPETGEETGWFEDVREDVPAYSSDIAAAWAVVERAAAQRSGFSLGYYPSAPEAERWGADFGGIGAFGPTAPIAICRAALLAVCGEGEVA